MRCSTKLHFPEFHTLNYTKLLYTGSEQHLHREEPHSGVAYTQDATAGPAHSAVNYQWYILFSAVQCSSVRCSAVHCISLHCSVVQCSAVQCSLTSVSDPVLLSIEPWRKSFFRLPNWIELKLPYILAEFIDYLKDPVWPGLFFGHCHKQLADYLTDEYFNDEMPTHIRARNLKLFYCIKMKTGRLQNLLILTLSWGDFTNRTISTFSRSGQRQGFPTNNVVIN